MKLDADAIEVILGALKSYRMGVESAAPLDPTKREASNRLLARIDRATAALTTHD